MQKIIQLGFISICLAGCSFAPTFQRPPMPVPEHFKETGKWLPAKMITPGRCVYPWWQAFQDPVLNQLENDLTVANQDLKLAFARYQEARALVQVATAAFFPTILGIFNGSRQQTSLHVANPIHPNIYNSFLVGADFSYELDAWGSIRNSVETSNDLAKASAADLAAVSLSLHAELATDYLTIRGYDEAQTILDTTVNAYQKALALTTRRYKGGVSSIADVDEAKTQYENARTLATEMRLKRAQMEHAIAVLTGRFPSDFSLAPGRLPRHHVSTSSPIPSTLLEYRPDIAAAEFRVMAANANIGVARAAFFPVFDLTGIAGYQSKTLANLISKPSLFWSLGPVTALSLAQPLASMVLFDGGRLLGLLKQANAKYYEAVASYRQTVLTAFQDVEDSLVAIRRLDEEEQTKALATKSANDALRQAQFRYKGGIITYLEVVVLDNIALQTRLDLVNIQTRRQIASVFLIKSLGGGWTNTKDSPDKC